MKASVTYIQTKNANGEIAFSGIEVAWGYAHKEELKAMGYKFNNCNNSWCKASSEETAIADLIDAVIACKLPAERAQIELDRAISKGYISANAPLTEETCAKLREYAGI